MMDNVVMTVPEVCDMLRISDKMVRKLFNTGVLKGFVVGHSFRISRASVEAVARGDVPNAGRRDHRVRRL